jgi:carbonic anhydrase
MRLLAHVVLFLGMVFVSSAQTSGQSTAAWDYQGKQGALVWGKLDPAYKLCSEGHQQSPIDIRGARLNQSLQPIEFHYLAGQVTLVNDGHAIIAKVNPGSYMVANGVRYDLVELTFHHPSETAVSGKLSDMEVHLVHKSTEGKLAILAVRMVEDVSNPSAVLAALWPHLPKDAGKSEKVTEMVNPGGLLPVERGYWTYEGSLSTPPCTEGVRWFVFEQQVTLNRDQLRIFANMFRINTRPLQDKHGRRIEASE